MNYQQLTEGRRYQISALLERGISVSEIAKTVQCHRSTVYRELKRGRKGRHYCPNEAQVLSIQKRTSERKYRIPQERIDFIRFLLEADWSLELISSVLTKAGAAKFTRTHALIQLKLLSIRGEQRLLLQDRFFMVLKVSVLLILSVY
ncbi:helix-turn-helix domain-containing protein [Vibrio tritonius]|uniref:Helix-turn-helix domain-containing protein n=1 Tax=Vibrio tritonius TaxID=1435069 RepID=A0ABS7YTR9_9VIBR|nr:helix-turn-helix domain-containing protein [Vibrio tritonius]MCA2019079.1 helix-turn-helix domain-containing protein [Vibrio tritonius]